MMSHYVSVLKIIMTEEVLINQNKLTVTFLKLSFLWPYQNSTLNTCGRIIYLICFYSMLIPQVNILVVSKLKVVIEN